jgi:capsular polysaccharide biosynthesis protein
MKIFTESYKTLLTNTKTIQNSEYEKNGKISVTVDDVGNKLTCFRNVNVVVTNRVYLNITKDINYYKSFVDFTDNRECMSGLNYVNIPSGFYLFHPWFGNFEHWIKDMMPKLELYFEFKKICPDLKLITINPYDHCCNYQYSLFEMLFRDLDIDKSIYFINRTDILSVDDLYVPPFELKCDLSSRVSSYMLKLKDRICTELDSNKEYLDIKNKIYISRRNLNNHWHNRKLMNEDEIIDKIMKPLGIQEIYLDEYDLKTQFQIIRNAKIVIGSVGAGLINFIFMKKNTKFIPIFHPLLTYDYENIIKNAELGIKYFAYLGNYSEICEVQSQPKDSFNVPWSIKSIDHLKHFIKEKLLIG